MSNQALQDREKRQDETARPPSFWRSRTGICLVAALAGVGFLLAYEHRVHLLESDWILWLPLVVCVGMHFFMHGGHGSGGDKS